jgi:tripartite-type tricarboxylate transporter receptor subunit TctC
MKHAIAAARRRAMGRLGATVATTFLALPLALAPAVAIAQSAYPAKPIRLVVPFPPGGATDVVARSIGQKLSDALGQPVVVENKAGASSNIGSEFVARSAPDGYTLLLGTIANATNMTYYPRMTYDTLRDLVPITQTMSAPSILVVHPSLPVKNLQELLAYARANPGKLSFASSGAGGSPHLAGEMLKLRAGIDMVHVPYKGAGPALQDTLAGNVQVAFKTSLSAVPHIQSGKLRGIAVAANKRVAQLPDVPTMAEAGMPDFEVSSWNGLLAPAGTPKEIVDRLYAETAKALRSPDLIERFAAQGAEPVGSSPEEFRAYIRAEVEKWGKVIKAAGISAEKS